MKTKQKWIKLGIVMTFISLLSLVLVFEYCRAHGWTQTLIVLEIISIVTLILSFIYSYVQTGLWSFTHKPVDKMDEREIAMASKSLRSGYAIFTVVVLCLLLFLSLTNNNISIVMVASVIVFAHILPASVIVWKKKVSFNS